MDNPRRRVYKTKRRKRVKRKRLLLLASPLVLLFAILALVLLFTSKGFRYPDPKVDTNPPPTQFDPEGVVNIGTRREVLWDTYLIDTEKTTAALTLHEPEKQQAVLELTETWEGTGSGGFNIIEAGGLYRMYYLAYELPTEENAGSYTPEVKVCYAESTDGITWEKPSLGLVKYDGSKENNILLYEKKDVFYNFFVFLDTNENTPEKERYKALAISEKDSRLIIYTSADGLSWKKSRAITTKLESGADAVSALHTAFWDETRQRYYSYFSETDGNGATQLYVTTSVDFKKWTQPQSISYGGDTAQFNLITANASPYYRAPHIYMGLPLRYTERAEWNAGFTALSGSAGRQSRLLFSEKYALGLTDTLFMTSRNGLDWDITAETWLTPGPEHDTSWVYGDPYTAHGMLETPALHSGEGQDNELSLYVSEGKWSEQGAALYRYTTRIDGFASYTAGYNTQKVVTKPLQFEGSRMLLNFSTSPGGHIYVRILDEDGNPFPSLGYTDGEGNAYEVPGYTSYEIVGNRVDREIAFNGDLSALNGQTVVLEFTMSDASIYSFKFDNEPYENTASWQPAAEIPYREYSAYSHDTSGEVLHIGSQRELLWDDYIVDAARTTAALTTHSATRAEAVLTTDQPWEGNACDYYNITEDVDENGQSFYRMYYLGWNNTDATDIRVCYAYSYDGSSWVKPNLGIHSYHDEATGITYGETNIILYTEDWIFDNFYVMKDTRDGIDESERYKAVAQGYTDPDGNESYGLWAWLSDDGIHWHKSHRILPHIGVESFDSLNTITWDEATGQYYLYFRVREDETLGGVLYGSYRHLMMASSPDFYTWDVSNISHLDYGSGAPSFEMYTNNINKYYRAEQVFLGFPTRFNRRWEWAKNYEYLAGTGERRRKYEEGQVTATLSMTETLFMTSRDGRSWNRRNESWLTPAAEYEANWIYGNCYPASGLIETATANPGQDGELSTYVFEGKYYTGQPSTLYRYTMRIDGLASYKATYKPQILTTKAFTFEGDTLLLNFKTSAAGSVRIRLLDANGNTLDGYDSGELFGDRVDRAVEFEKSLAELNGQAVVMEITMSDAEVYSFKFGTL